MKRGQKNGSGKTIDRSRVFGDAYPNIAAFYERLESGQVQPAFETHQASQNEGDMAIEFTKTATYDEATDLLLNGDEDSKKRIAENGVAAILKQPQKDERVRQRVLSPCGFFPHVPNAIAGRPNSMIAERTQKVRKRVVTVAYNLAVNCNISAEDMQQAAADVVAAILKCEKSGVRVNLYAVSVTKDGGDYCAFAIKIKDSAQHLDLLKMAYPLTHPSMLRRHEFRYTETQPGLPDSFRFGYGYAESKRETVEQVLSCIGVTADSVLSYYDVHTMTHQQIMDEITGQNK